MEPKEEFSFDVISKDFSSHAVGVTDTTKVVSVSWATHDRYKSTSRLSITKSRCPDLPEVLAGLFRGRIHCGFDMIFLSRAN